MIIVVLRIRHFLVGLFFCRGGFDGVGLLGLWLFGLGLFGGDPGFFEADQIFPGAGVGFNGGSGLGMDAFDDAAFGDFNFHMETCWWFEVGVIRG